MNMTDIEAPTAVPPQPQLQLPQDMPETKGMDLEESSTPSTSLLLALHAWGLTNVTPTPTSSLGSGHRLTTFYLTQQG